MALWETILFAMMEISLILTADNKYLFWRSTFPNDNNRCCLFILVIPIWYTMAIWVLKNPISFAMMEISLILTAGTSENEEKY